MSSSDMDMMIGNIIEHKANTSPASKLTPESLKLNIIIIIISNVFHGGLFL